MAVVSEEAQARRREMWKDLYRWYKEHGICPRCKNWCEPGMVYCASCYRKVRNYKKRREKNGISNSEQCRERRERLKAAGVCVACGKRPATGGKTTCNVCEAKRRESREAYNLRQRLKKQTDMSLVEGRHYKREAKP